MLLRNLDVNSSRYNGTRLKVDMAGRFILGCRFISSQRNGDFIAIPRIDLCCGGAAFRLRRRQVPFQVAFALTICKTLGQAFSRTVSPEDVFSHGYLYTAL